MAKKTAETVVTPPEAEPEEQSLSPFRALWGVISRPSATFERMRETGRGHWWLVFVLILVAVLISVIATVPINAELQQRIIESQTQGLSDQQMASVGQVQAIVSSQAVLGAISFFSQIVGVGIGVAVRAGVIYLLGMALGARASFKTTWNMAVWTILPNAARLLAMAIAIFATGQMSSPGLTAVLSGAEYGDASQVLLRFLREIDIYLVWTLFLIWVGVQATAQLNRTKSGIVAAAYLAVTLIFTLGFAAIGDLLAGMTFGGGPGARRGPG